jgi:hypothetical protein
VSSAVSQARERGWERQECGWWTHPEHGGVCREIDGWWHYPAGIDYPPPRGPYRTMTEAMDAAEKGAQP